MTRDLFGRLLCLATSIDIDLAKVFNHLLTPVSMAFAHVDGSPHKTDKSALMKKLKGMIDSNPPAEIDVSIVDAMFFIRTLSNLPSTFGGVAGVILKIICQLAKEVHLICDTYKSPSVKDIERELRG